MSESHARAAAGLAVCLFLSAALVWVRIDRTPPSWDDGYYLTSSLQLYDTLGVRGIPGWVQHSLTVMRSKPPLIAVLATPVYLTLGRKYRAAYLVNLLFLGILFGAIYGIASRYAGARAGLIAVIAAGTLPAVWGLAHWYLVECGLMALVCATLWLLVGWSESSGPGRAAALGIVCGLGMLMKASFPVYVAAPLAYFAFVRRDAVLRKQLAIAFGIPVLVIAAPWCVVNLRPMIGTALRAGSADTARIYNTGEALSLHAIARYIADLALITPLLYLAAIPLLAWVGRAALKREGRRGLVLVAVWLTLVLFLAAGHYRDLRYAAPLIPAVALVLAIVGDAAIRCRRVAGIAVGGVLALGTLNMLQSSFGLGKPLRLGGLLLDPPRFYYCRPYDRSAWPLREILSDIDQHARLVGGERRSVLLGTNSLHFNADNFMLEATAGRLPLDIGTTAYLKNAESLAGALSTASYFIYKEGGEQDQANFNGEGAAAVNQARSSSRFMELPVSRKLPDGGVAHVFAAIARQRYSPASAFLSAGLEEVPSCRVTFGSQIQLTGIGVSRSPEGLKVNYRWRCIAPMNRDYWCFTHVVDGSGRVIGYLDHRFLKGDPPTSVWKPGDIALEELVFPLSRGNPSELRVGVYHRESGDRLPATEASFPLIQDHTAAVVACPK